MLLLRRLSFVIGWTTFWFSLVAGFCLSVKIVLGVYGIQFSWPILAVLTLCLIVFIFRALDRDLQLYHKGYAMVGFIAHMAMIVYTLAGFSLAASIFKGKLWLVLFVLCFNMLFQLLQWLRVRVEEAKAKLIGID